VRVVVKCHDNTRKILEAPPDRYVCMVTASREEILQILHAETPAQYCLSSADDRTFVNINDLKTYPRLPLNTCIFAERPAHGNVTRRAMRHKFIVDVMFALPDLPAYVLMWILNWLPELKHGTDLEKIRIMERFLKSRKKVHAKRSRERIEFT
jgi:hypothetical protein